MAPVELAGLASGSIGQKGVAHHDGVVAVVESLNGHPLFAHITLTRSERSQIAALVTELLEEPINFTS